MAGWSRTMAATAVAAVFAWTAAAQAAEQQQAAPSPSDTAAAQQEPCAAQPVQCHPKPCIRYRTHVLCRTHCCDTRCLPAISTVLRVCDPCSGCEIDVPVCLPGCCQGKPKVCVRTGLLVRGVATYRWCCGYTIKVVFLRSGDITVHYLGE